MRARRSAAWQGSWALAHGMQKSKTAIQQMADRTLEIMARPLDVASLPSGHDCKMNSPAANCDTRPIFATFINECPPFSNSQPMPDSGGAPKHWRIAKGHCSLLL